MLLKTIFDIARAIIQGNIKAVLWDLDGNILDTEQLAQSGWLMMLGKHGFEATRVDTEKFIGLSRDDSRVYAKERWPGIEYDVLRDERDAWMVAEIAANGVPLREGAGETIRALHKLGVRQAVVTTSINEHATERLTHHGLVDCFEFILGGDEVKALGKPGKPHQWPYQEAMRRLGVSAEESAICEDSANGIRSAARSGAAVVIVVPDLSPIPDELLNLSGMVKLESYTEFAAVLNAALGE